MGLTTNLNWFARFLTSTVPWKKQEQSNDLDSSVGRVRSKPSVLNVHSGAWTKESLAPKTSTSCIHSQTKCHTPKKNPLLLWNYQSPIQAHTREISKCFCKVRGILKNVCKHLSNHVSLIVILACVGISYVKNDLRMCQNGIPKGAWNYKLNHQSTSWYKDTQRKNTTSLWQWFQNTYLRKNKIEACSLLVACEQWEHET